MLSEKQCLTQFQSQLHHLTIITREPHNINNFKKQVFLVINTMNLQDRDVDITQKVLELDNFKHKSKSIWIEWQ